MATGERYTNWSEVVPGNFVSPPPSIFHQPTTIPIRVLTVGSVIGDFIDLSPSEQEEVLKFFRETNK